MSQALAKINSSTVARTDPLITDAEAEIAALKCGFDERQLTSLRRVVSKKILGKYLAAEVFGNIATDCHMDLVNLERVEEWMMDLAKPGDGEASIQIEAAKTFCRIIQQKDEVRTLFLKAAEIGGHTRSKNNSDPVGPPIDVDSISSGESTSWMP